jgi:IclR family pca regulon transcriptional regulator
MDQGIASQLPIDIGNCREPICRRRRTQISRTPHTVTDKKRLREILNEVSAEGYALTSGELEEGLRSIAVPVRSGSGRTVAAINVSTQVGRVTKAQMLKEFFPILRTTAQRLGAALPA